MEQQEIINTILSKYDEDNASPINPIKELVDNDLVTLEIIQIMLGKDNLKGMFQTLSTLPNGSKWATASLDFQADIWLNGINVLGLKESEDLSTILTYIRTRLQPNYWHEFMSEISFLEADLHPDIINLIMPFDTLSKKPSNLAKTVIKHKNFPIEKLMEMYEKTDNKIYLPKSAEDCFIF